MSQSKANGKGQMHMLGKTSAALFLAATGAAGAAFGQAAPYSSTGPFYDYGLPDTGKPGQPGFAPAPFLENNSISAANVSSILAARQAAGQVLAIKVREPLTDPSAIAVFNNYRVQYVFSDFEDAARVGRTRALADQVLSSSKSSGAFVGNFNFYPNSSIDGTRPPSLSGSQASSFQLPARSTEYSTSRGNLGTPSGGTLIGNQTADPALYPGSPDYRNPAQGNSGAPNIRSALFTLPIQRITLAELGIKGFSGVPGGSAGYAVSGPNASYNGLAGGRQQLIPYVTRFNNYGNPALGGGPFGTGFVQNAAFAPNGQLLSRGDFQAQILHYRLRGADSVHLFNESAGSVIGYGPTQEQGDVKIGWANSALANGIFARQGYAFANLTNVIGDNNSNSGDVNPRSTEIAGTVWSGVYDRGGFTDPSTGRRRLLILLSNMSGVRKIVDLPNNIGGFSTFKPPGSTSLDRFDDFQIDPGQHRLLQFSLQNSSRGRTEWVFTGDSFIGLDSNRNGVGIPEPTSLSLIGVGSIGLLARRRRPTA